MITDHKAPWHQHEAGGKKYANVRDSAGRCVADCGSRSDEIAQNNAKLIAAAPDLLEACKEIHKAIGEGDPVDIANKCAGLVIPAIAKATS
jgi:hypothetical protein